MRIGWRLGVALGLLLALCFHGDALWGQGGKARIIFTDTVFDFQRIQEDGGPAEHSFAFVNGGDAPLILQSVGTSCGCTASEWPKQPILPGEKGHVKAVFNPSGRPHGFVKVLTVRSNAEPAVVTLRIEGYVIPKRLMPSQRFMMRVGGLGLERPFIPLGSVLNTGEATGSIAVYNFDSKPQAVKFTPEGKGVLFTPAEVAVPAGDSVSVTVRLEGSKLEGWGFGERKVKVQSGGQEVALRLGYTRDEDFSRLSAADRANAPAVGIEESKYNFQVVTEGDVVEHTFELKNTGGRPLEIREVHSPCQCIAVKADGRKVKPGAKTQITVKFNTRGYAGNQFKQVVVITNDPTSPQQLLEVYGQVVTAGK